MKAATIAAVCHAVNAAYCESLGDTSQAPWNDAPELQKASAIAGVKYRLVNLEATPEEMHASWLADKIAAGWTVGPVKDEAKKEHPCCVPYDELPPEQRAKDYLFRGVVDALKDLPDGELPATGATATVFTTPAGQKFLPVKYIGRREVYREGMYGTGLVFTQGETKFVVEEKALQLLRHPDVYVPGDGEAVEAAAIEAKPDDTVETDDLAQIERDSLTRMTKAALTEYAKTRYRIELDPNMLKDDLRTEVTRLIDQYGIV